MQDRLCYRVLLVLLLIATSGLSRSLAQQNDKAHSHPQPHESEQTNAQAEPGDPLGRSTPHGTVVGFLQAAQSGKYSDAAQYLQLSKTERALKGERIAQQLHELMDDTFVGRVGSISNRREGSPSAGGTENHETIGAFRVDDTETNVELVRIADARSGEIWLFSSQTLAAVPELVDQLDSDRVEARLPRFLATKRILHTPFWRLLVFLLLIPVSYALAWGFVRLFGAAFHVWLRRQHRPILEDILASAAAPAKLILTVAFHRVGVYFLGIALLFRVYYNRIVALLLLAGVAWLGFRVINVWAKHARSRALASSRDSSGSIVLLGQRILKALLVVTVALAALAILGFDITTAVAGLGIGSIAIAFAAQKTLENLLGGISILGDQVIRVGETCRIGDKQGKVEDISLRSTTIRTLERTQLSVPNGQLSNMNVENISRSDKSLFRTKLELRRETSAGHLSVLLQEMRTMLMDHPEVDPEGTRVHFVGFGESSLDVEVFCHIRTTQLLEFLAIREDLLLRIMKLVGAAGIEFAIPSRSLYLSQDHPNLDEQRTGENEGTSLESRPRLEKLQRRTGT
jgi:MscS family membrane protein